MSDEYVWMNADEVEPRLPPYEAAPKATASIRDYTTSDNFPFNSYAFVQDVVDDVVDIRPAVNEIYRGDLEKVEPSTFPPYRTVRYIFPFHCGNPSDNGVLAEHAVMAADKAMSVRTILAVNLLCQPCLWEPSQVVTVKDLAEVSCAQFIAEGDHLAVMHPSLYMEFTGTVRDRQDIRPISETTVLVTDKTRDYAWPPDKLCLLRAPTDRENSPLVFSFTERMVVEYRNDPRPSVLNCRIIEEYHVQMNVNLERGLPGMLVLKQYPKSS